MNKYMVFESEKMESNKAKELDKKAIAYSNADILICGDGITLKKISNVTELYHQGRNIYLITVHCGGLCLEKTNIEDIDSEQDRSFNPCNIIGYLCTYYDNGVKPTYFVAI